MPWVDPNDPNYVSDDDTENTDKNADKAGNAKAVAKGGTTTLKTMVPEMSEEDVTKAVEPLILEYFENNDAMEVALTLQVSQFTASIFCFRRLMDSSSIPFWA